MPFDASARTCARRSCSSRLREREVDNKIQVTDAEIDMFLAEAREASRQRAEYNVAHILVRVPEQATPSGSRQRAPRAQKALAELRAGADFAQLAASYSDAPDALQGGDLGWRTPTGCPPCSSTRSPKLKPGEVSDVAAQPGRLPHRSSCTSGAARPPPARGAADARCATSCCARNELVSETEARQRLTDLRERIVNGGADFAELARMHSDDASAASGGDLGWIYPGDTVPEFERAMSELKIGEVSQPVQTPFGWHLIQVLERRVGRRAPGAAQALQARQALRERKADEAYQEWLRQMRDRAYVELRLEER